MTTSALISAGIAAASAAAGGIGSALNRKRAREEELRNYTQAKDYLNSMYYRDPLSTVGNRSLLKAARQNYAEGMDALNNRMAAGGATMENQLAAMKSANQGMDKLYGQLLMGEDARRDRIAAQRMQLDSQHSSAVQSGYMQAAQDWNQWGGQMAQAGMSLMNAGLLGGGSGGLGAGLGAGNAAGSVPADWAVPAAAAEQNTGGLKGVYRNKYGVLMKGGD